MYKRAVKVYHRLTTSGTVKPVPPKPRRKKKSRGRAILPPEAIAARFLRKQDKLQKLALVKILKSIPGSSLAVHSLRRSALRLGSIGPLQLYIHGKRPGPAMDTLIQVAKVLNDFKIVRFDTQTLVVLGCEPESLGTLAKLVNAR